MDTGNPYQSPGTFFPLEKSQKKTEQEYWSEAVSLIFGIRCRSEEDANLLCTQELDTRVKRFDRAGDIALSYALNRLFIGVICNTRKSLINELFWMNEGRYDITRPPLLRLHSDLHLHMGNRGQAQQKYREALRQALLAGTALLE
jgi:hypothetical protein